MKKKKILSLIICFSMILGTVSLVGATAYVRDAYVPSYDTYVNGELVSKDLLANIGGETYFNREIATKLGIIKTWNGTERIATFDTPDVTENENIDLYESQKAVVRVAITGDIVNEVTDDEDSTQLEVVAENETIVIGNGFFIEGRKILTTRDVYENYKYVLGNKNVGTDTGNPLDTIQNVTGIKIILWDGSEKDAKNFRFDDDRILGTLDTLGYTSKNIVELGKDMSIGDTSYMCTSIASIGQEITDETNTTTINENPLQVPNQWSVNKVLRVRYPRDNQYFTLISNDNDNSDSGRGGAVFNQSGKLTGIFCAIEDGNNGNCLVKPASEITEYIED